MNGLSAHQTETLSGAVALDLLSRMASGGSSAVLSYLVNGKWHTCLVSLTSISDCGLVLTNISQLSQSLQINQPVGMACQFDFQKVIFESTVVGYESSAASARCGKILIEPPEKVEIMQRRAYQRQQVPPDLNIQVLFWHRGYIRPAATYPKDSYWQGRLVNLSAGGAQITVNAALCDNFSEGQFVGLQFTPLPCQKPVLLEGKVIHCQMQSEQGQLILGVEFLGLEACIEGRQRLHRLLDIVCQYESTNQQPSPVIQ